MARTATKKESKQTTKQAASKTDLQQMRVDYAKLKMDIYKGTEKNVALLKKARKEIAKHLTALNSKTNN